MKKEGGRRIKGSARACVAERERERERACLREGWVGCTEITEITESRRQEVGGRRREESSQGVARSIRA